MGTFGFFEYDVGVVVETSVGGCLETTSGDAMELFAGPAAFDPLGILGSVDEPGEGTCGFFE